MKPYAHQLQNACDLLVSIRKCGTGIDASHTGTGKSLTALLVARVLKLKPMIVCPLSVGAAWESKGAQAGVPLDWINYEKARVVRGKGGGPGWLAKKIGCGEVDPSTHLFIFDESHRIKAPTSLQSGLAMGVCDRGFKTLQLSATPFSSPLETRAVLHLTGRVTELSQWYRRLTDLGCRRMTWIRGKPWKWDGDPQDIVALREHLRDNMVATKWTDVEGFPDIVVDPVAFTLPPADRKRVDELRATLDPTNIGDTAAERIELEMIRVPAMVEQAKDAMSDGNSVCVFFNYTEPLKEFVLRTSCDYIDGSVQTARRKEIADTFQSATKPTLIALNAQAGGEGIDLHDTNGIPRLEIISPPYSAILLNQIIGRIHRIGGRSKAVCRILFAADTVESDSIMPRVIARRENIASLTDRDLT